MRIANGMTGIRLHLTKEDYEMFSDHGMRESLSVVLNHESTPEDFLELCADDLPGGHRVNFVKSKKEMPFPDTMLLTHQWYKKMKKLPYFSFEEVHVAPNLTHHLGGWMVSRPPMERKSGRNVPRSQPAPKKRGRQVAEDKALAIPVKAETLVHQMEELAASVKNINEAKTLLGDMLVVEVREGLLVAYIQIGGA